jgi:predicted Zn-dependent protease
MISADQLLSQAEKALDRKNWQQAEDLLNRNEAVQGNNNAARYLRAVFDFRRGDYAAATNKLEGLLAEGSKDPFVHLFLADLYQYHLGDKNRAAEYLSNYLLFRYDPDIEKRFFEIRNIK